MQIPGYTIESKLGQGGMAEVYLAIQESLGRQVALKVTSQRQTQDPAFKERFLQEGRIVATLNHPNIVTIHEIGQVDEHYFIAMEYVSGDSLSERIEEGMALEDSIQTVKRIARALAYAHKGGFLHRDIKPSNILFRDGEYAVLADFGIATDMFEDDTRLTQTGMSPGSPAYMSPEQVNGQKLDARSDQYSLGIVFYEMLTGERPYKGNSATATAIMHLTAPVPELPYPFESWQPIFDRILAKTPEERFDNEEALIQALDDPSSVEPRARGEGDKHAATTLSRTQVRMENTRGATPNIVPKPDGAVSSSMRRWGGVAALSAAVIAGAVFWLQSTSDDPGDHLVQEDKQEIAAELPVDEAEVATTQETDRKEEQGKTPDTQETAESQVIDSEPEITAMPGLNGQQTNSPNLQEPAGSQTVEAEPEVAPMSGINGQQANSQGIHDPVDSQTVEAETETAQIAEINKAPTGSLEVQEPTGSPVAEAELEDAQAPKLTEESLEIEEPVDSEVVEAETEVAEVPPQISEIKKTQPDSLEVQEPTDSQIVEAEPEEAQAPKLTDESPEVQEPVDSEVVEAETEVAEVPGLNEEQANIPDTQELADSQNTQAQTEQSSPSDSNEPQLSPSVTEEPGDSQVAKAETELNSEPDINKELTDMLSAAEDQMAAERYMEPARDNAFEMYTAILTNNPDNPAAIQGLTRITEYYAQQARLKLDSGELEQSLSFLDLGLKVAPKNSELIALHNEVAVKLEKQQTQQQIETLLQKAEAQLGGQRWARPKGDNAYETYQAILALDASHQQAQQGVQHVAQKYKNFAQSKRQAGDLRTGLAMAERGLEVAPENAGLLALRKELAGLLDEQQASQAEIERLLAIGQQQLDAGQLTQPKGKNARESYNAVLKMAPENQQARTGLNAVSQRYDALARVKQSAGDVEAAFSLVEEGLQAFPKHSGLRALHDEIESQLEAAKQAQKTPIEPQPIAKKPKNKKPGTRVFGTF